MKKWHKHPPYLILHWESEISTGMLRCQHLEYRRFLGRTRAEAITRPLPTPAAQVRSQVRRGGIYCIHSGTGESFFRVLGFLLAILISPTTPHSSSIIRSWCNRWSSGCRAKWTPHRLTSCGLRAVAHIGASLPHTGPVTEQSTRAWARGAQRPYLACG
jgi:hypothetical protein